MNATLAADRSDRGMTLIEMMIALVVFGIVIAGAFSFLQSQGRGFRLGTERATTLQNLRYAANVLELDLRTLGSNVPDEQPFVIYAGSDVIAFSADYATNVADDPWAVYYEPDAPTQAVSALRMAQAFTLPLTSYTYPDTNYPPTGAINSPAETVVFWFSSDSSTSRTDDYVLYRQVNLRTAEAIARDLLQTGSEPFFKYFRLKSPPSAAQYVDSVPNDSLPLIHRAAIHGSLADTGRYSAAVDSIRGVEVSLSATNAREGADERVFAIQRTVRFPNAGLAVKMTCGDTPQLGTALTATPGVNPGDGIHLIWGQATDESTGELDVQRYVLWRRDLGAAEWGPPFLSIPAGQPSYVFDDLTVVSGNPYEYALAAQDCTPSLSSLSIPAPVVAP